MAARQQWPERSWEMRWYRQHACQLIRDERPYLVAFADEEVVDVAHRRDARVRDRSAYHPRSAHARAIAAMIGVRIVPPCVGRACAITTIAVGSTSGMRSVASSRSSMRRASSRMNEVCGNRHDGAAVYACVMRPLVA